MDVTFLLLFHQQKEGNFHPDEASNTFAAAPLNYISSQSDIIFLKSLEPPVS